MSRSTLFLLSGLVLFLAGGAVIALGGERIGVPVGTTLGLAGVGLMVWGWFSRSPGENGQG